MSDKDNRPKIIALVTIIGGLILFAAGFVLIDLVDVSGVFAVALILCIIGSAVFWEGVNTVRSIRKNKNPWPPV